MIWIRSQNKEVLIECNKVFGKFYMGCVIFGNDVLLGVYSTKEKALKVLDMIQERIGNIENIKSNQCMVNPNFFIFQMPLDSEVEE